MLGGPALGSIPARAGEPNRTPALVSQDPVYPRACGGTRHLVSPHVLAGGLSPRVRGNPLGQSTSSVHHRSIPARAGEPVQDNLEIAERRVYPRACGGTHRPSPATVRMEGLSPRVRGNRFCRPLGYIGRRSIPARAGEPRRRSGNSPTSQVYPRACGGTIAPSGPGTSDPGLSPRVRGNQGGPSATAAMRRSIPARAGEP